MSESPSYFRDQEQVDEYDLRLLSIFHVIGAWLGLAGLFLLIAHYTMFRVVWNNSNTLPQQGHAPGALEVFAMGRWLYLVFGLWFIASVALNAISGLCISARRHRVFSLIVAGIDCLFVPLGTVLGVFTMVVLVRDSVRGMYKEE